MSVTVTALNTAAIKGTRLVSAARVTLNERGAEGDRRFFLADGRQRMRNAKQIGSLQQLVAGLDGDRLSVTFPDGGVICDQIQLGQELECQFYSHRVMGQLVLGPWADAISEFCGTPLRLLAAGSAVDRGARGAVSLVSRASLQRLAHQAGAEAVDARRFRMLIEVDGVAAHAEDGWLGQRLQVGSAVLRFDGHVGRCLVTSRDPQTGEVTLPTLDLLRAYRSGLESTEPLPFGVYGRVLKPGVVSVGDSVTPLP
jgi:uncharacterized protein YcbX